MSAETGVPVSIDFSYSIELNNTAPDTWLSAWARIDGSFFDEKYIQLSNQGVIDIATNTSLGSHLETFAVPYNVWQLVRLDVRAEATRYTEYALLAEAHIDPAIFLGSNWLAGHPNDEVIFSSVIAPIPAVPEPECYALIIAGLGLLGCMARRNKERIRVIPG